MKPQTTFIFFILAGSFHFSCSENVKQEKPIPSLTLTDIFSSDTSKASRSDPFLLGNKFRISYETYGCFHYLYNIIDVEEKDGRIIVTQKDNFSIKKHSSARIDSSYALALNNFCSYYNQLLELKAKLKPDTKFSIGTIYRLTIHGGLMTKTIFCEASELRGYVDLVNRLNLITTDDNGN